MKIESNNIGNYAPKYIQNVKPNIKPAQISENAATEKINDDEKKFFMNLYPENKNEIVDYHFYQKTGKMSGVSVGSLFDKRG